jgi:hypothetical protein
MLIALAVMLTVTAGTFTVMNPSSGIFQAQPEAADLQQRLRVGVDTLRRSLMMAGAGAYAGSRTGPLNGFLAPILPYRVGRIATLDDGAGAFRTDAITIFSVPATASQTELSAPLPPGSSQFSVEHQPGCPVGRELCGFEAGMGVLIHDGTSAFESMIVTEAIASTGYLQRRQQADLSKQYDAGTTIVEMTHRVYYLDRPTNRLMQYDGYLTPAPVLDNVIELAFEYYGEPVPPALRRPGVDRSMTYGPTPPDLDVARDGWPAGESCVIAVAEGRQIPRLAALGPAGSGLVRLDPGLLTDGPWCPDDTSPNRFDADLLRVRSVRVAFRLQTGNASLRRALSSGRGARSALFTNPGTSVDRYREVPDRAIHFDVTPRNLNLER